MRLAYLSAAALAACVHPLVCSADDGSADAGASGGGAAPAPKARTRSKPKAALVQVGETHVVWVMPGHPHFPPRTVVRTSPEVAERLRASGHARPAHPDEVRAVDAKTIPTFGI